jgi:hypothetical protein
MRVFARYLVLQIPGQFIAAVTLVMLVRWTELTPMLAGLLFVLWVIKDLAMFPVTRIGDQGPRDVPRDPHRLRAAERRTG